MMTMRIAIIFAAFAVATTLGCSFVAQAFIPIPAMSHRSNSILRGDSDVALAAVFRSSSRGRGQSASSSSSPLLLGGSPQLRTEERLTYLNSIVENQQAQMEELVFRLDALERECVEFRRERNDHRMMGMGTTTSTLTTDMRMANNANSDDRRRSNLPDAPAISTTNRHTTNNNMRNNNDIYNNNNNYYSNNRMETMRTNYYSSNNMRSNVMKTNNKAMYNNNLMNNNNGMSLSQIQHPNRVQHRGLNNYDSKANNVDNFSSPDQMRYW